MFLYNGIDYRRSNFSGVDSVSVRSPVAAASLDVKPVARWRRPISFARSVYQLWQQRGTAYIVRYSFLRLLGRVGGPMTYASAWVPANETVEAKDYQAIHARIESLIRRPFISVVLTCSGHSSCDAQRTVASVLAQIYDHWELCIVVHPKVSWGAKFALSRLSARDSRIHALTLTSSDYDQAQARAFGLDQARGDYVVFLDGGDSLSDLAFYLIAETVEEHPEAALIYSDEDQIDDNGSRSNPIFKPQWSPDLQSAYDYVGSFAAFRRSIVKSVGGISPGFGSASLYDLVWRVAETCKPLPHDQGGEIHHLPFILAHRWTGHPLVGDDRIRDERRALQEHLRRTDVEASVGEGRQAHLHRVRRSVPNDLPRVSLIIPTRDRLELLRGAVDSILEKTTYPNYEILVLDNESVEPETLAYFSSLANEPRVRILRYEYPFNYSAINNYAARHCDSPLLGLVNNDILVIEPDWLTELVSQIVRPEVGAVGSMLYYPNDKIQHAGILIGYGGGACNANGGLDRGAPGYMHRAEVIQNYSAVTAACLLTRADVFREVGGLDEQNLKVAFNDVDYCLKVRKHGYLVVWTPYAELYHLESASRGDDMAPEKFKRFLGEVHYLRDSWVSLMENDPYYSPNLSLEEGVYAIARKSRSHRPWLPKTRTIAAIGAQPPASLQE